MRSNTDYSYAGRPHPPKFVDATPRPHAPTGVEKFAVVDGQTPVRSEAVVASGLLLADALGQAKAYRKHDATSGLGDRRLTVVSMVSDLTVAGPGYAPPSKTGKTERRRALLAMPPGERRAAQAAREKEIREKASGSSRARRNLRLAEAAKKKASKQSQKDSAKAEKKAKRGR